MEQQDMNSEEKGMDTVIQRITQLVNMMLDRKPDASCEEIRRMLIEITPAWEHDQISNEMLPTIYHIETLERKMGRTKKEEERTWGWYSERMEKRNGRVCVYKNIQGEEVILTCVTDGPVPIDPYEGRCKDVKMVGELSSYVRSVGESKRDSFFSF